MSNVEVQINVKFHKAQNPTGIKKGPSLKLNFDIWTLTFEIAVS
jgi:hypothetical protein